MSSDKELMQQALEALEEINKLSIGEHAICLPAEIDGAMDALRERLAQPEQKPYAWMAVGGTIWRHKATEDDTPLYTHPPQRKPLTKDEIRDGARKTDPAGEDLCSWSFECGVRFAEDAHGIKGNT